MWSCNDEESKVNRAADRCLRWLPMSQLTLKAGIERILHEIPEITSVEAAM